MVAQEIDKLKRDSSDAIGPGLVATKSKNVLKYSIYLKKMLLIWLTLRWILFLQAIPAKKK